MTGIDGSASAVPLSQDSIYDSGGTSGLPSITGYTSAGAATITDGATPSGGARPPARMLARRHQAWRHAGTPPASYTCRSGAPSRAFSSPPGV